MILSLNNAKKRKNAKCIFIYDFSKLYTKLPLNKFLDILFQLILLFFKEVTKFSLELALKERRFEVKRLYWDVLLTH